MPGTTAVVIGVGGLGLLAVQFLRTLCSARVIAVDNDKSHLQLAKEDGADNTLSKLLKNATTRFYPGFPHGMPTTHANQINGDLLAFVKSASGAREA